MLKQSYLSRHSKKKPREKIWTIPFLLESPKNKEYQPPDLEIDFLIDSGAQSNRVTSLHGMKSEHYIYIRI